MDRFERIVEITPAYDKRHENPRKNYGIGSSVMTMILRECETKQAVQFKISLGWYLPGSLPEESPLPRKVHRGYRDVVAESSDPMPYDLGYHSVRPRYEGQHKMDDDCPITGGVCYYDGSSLNAFDAWAVLVSKGHEGLWAFLESYYANTFGEPAPQEPP